MLSGQEAAALLFGGVASDYVISTVDTNSLNINFMAHVDGWGKPPVPHGHCLSKLLAQLERRWLQQPPILFSLCL